MNPIDALTAATKSHLPENDESAVKLLEALQSAQQALLAAEAGERSAAEERLGQPVGARHAGRRASQGEARLKRRPRQARSKSRCRYTS